MKRPGVSKAAYKLHYSWQGIALAIMRPLFWGLVGTLISGAIMLFGIMIVHFLYKPGSTSFSTVQLVIIGVGALGGAVIMARTRTRKFVEDQLRFIQELQEETRQERLF